MTSNIPDPDEEITRTEEEKQRLEQLRIQKEKKFKPKEAPQAHPSEFWTFVKSNSRDMIAYVILIFGIILILFQSYLGGLFVGTVIGMYFYEQLVYGIQHARQLLNSENEIARTLILGGISIAFFLSAPFIFIGTFITLGIIHLVQKKPG